MNEDAGKRKGFLTAAKPFKDTKTLFTGGVICYPSAEEARFGFSDNGVNKAFCRRVCLFVNN